MGTDSLPKIAAAPALVNATSTQYNSVVDALQGHQVMRDSNGALEDNTSDIGRPSSGRPRKIYVGTGINVSGSDIDLSAITLRTTGVSSGKSKDSGFPDFLTPLGPTGGSENTFIIEAADTNLEMTIDGQAYTLEADLESDDLALAPSSNNTAIIDHPVFSDQEFTKTIGEYGFWMTVGETGGSGVGSEITSLDGTTQTFKLDNGETTEYFIATIDTTNDRIIPIKRGIGGTDRIVFSDGDTITLMKTHYIFLDNDLVTIDTTTNYPIWSSVAPTSPSTGDYWYDVANDTWKRYSGSSWEQLGRIYLGYAICDSSDCVACVHVDYNLAWSDDLKIHNISYLSADEISINGELYVNVAGTKIKMPNNSLTIGFSTNLESGVSETASMWYYLYISNTGVFCFSDKAPRRINEKLGWYHPSEYWRAISVFYNRSDSDLLVIRNNINDDEIVIPRSTAVVTLSDTGYTLGGKSIYEADIPVIVNNIDVFINAYNAAGDLGENIIAGEITPVTSATLSDLAYYEMAANGASGKTQVANNIKIPFVNNQLITMSIIGSNTNFLYISKMKVRF